VRINSRKNFQPLREKTQHIFQSRVQRTCKLQSQDFGAAPPIAIERPPKQQNHHLSHRDTMKSQTAILLAATLLAGTTSAAPTALGSLTFGSPICGSDFSHPVSGFDPSDCTPSFNQLLADICISGVCTIPANPNGFGVTSTVRTCTTLLGFEGGDNGATFNEAPVQAVFPGFLAQCTTTPGDESGLPGQFSTNGLLFISFQPSEGFE
jgi:hypothetical protein